MFRRVVLVVALLTALALIPVGAQAQSPGRPLPIPTPEVNTGLPAGLTQYSDVAATINDIVRRSDRVRAEVLGQSAGGRDLYLVTVSSRDADREGTKALRNLMLTDPARAQQLVAQNPGFRVPVMFNCSIHGNEYEGVDACIDLIRRLAFDNDETTQAILENAIVIFNVVQNPDGYVLNTRPNANGFDVNRDFITNSQPESALVRDVLVQWNPMFFLDFHGYVNPMLIEPTTPPHNPNYEYDLYIVHALGQAIAMEQGVLGVYDRLRNDPEFADRWSQFIEGPLNSTRATIPFRDWGVGEWDDWPPIFAPMYAMYHGAFGSTLESPLNPRTGSDDQRAARAVVNRAAHEAAGWSALQYVVDNKVDMVTDQLEIFRRGGDAVTPTPVDPTIVPGWGPEDEYTAAFPEAYIIPVGDSQRSELDAARLVNFLMDHGVQVGTARSGGVGYDDQRYPAGSYVVSMKQPKRGLANTILEPGWDISFKSPQMYDISGWSHRELWGATVVTVPLGTPVRGQTDRTRNATVAGSIPAGDHAAYSFAVGSEQAIKATNALADADVALHRTDDGHVVAPGSARSILEGFVAEGLTVDGHAEVPADAEAVRGLRIAASVGTEERHVLSTNGFDFTNVTVAGFNNGTLDFDDFDVLLVSSGFAYNSLNVDAREAFEAWLGDGGGVVAVGTTGATFNTQAGLLSATSTLGPACATANGVVAVDNRSGSVVAGGFPASDSSFVFAPVWYTNLGDEVNVEQSLSTDKVLIAGHWLGDFEDWEGDTDPGGARCGSARQNSEQSSAAGQALTISGVDETGGRVVAFGGSPMFRDHPKKLYQQLTQAMLWVAAR